MKRKIIRITSTLMLIVLMLALLPAAFALKAPQKLIITTGDLWVDYMARDVMKNIDTSGSTDYAKIKAVYTWIIKNCDRSDNGSAERYSEDKLTAGAAELEKEYNKLLEQDKIIIRDPFYALPDDAKISVYDTNGVVSQWAYQMLQYRWGHCGNYAALLNVMLGLLGYECHMVDGVFINNDGSKVEHKWNYVLVGGEYYWLDVRMDHATYTRTGSIDYKYFMVTDTAHWKRSHEWAYEWTDVLYQYKNAQTQGLAATGFHFWDTSESWARDYIDTCFEKGYFSGTADGYFTPNGLMTRAMLVAVLHRYDGDESEYKADFKDVKAGKWYTDSVAWAQHNDVVSGMTKTTFEPDTNVTREQAAAILYRYANLKGYDTSARGDLDQFKDKGKISDYAVEAFDWANGAGIISGKGDGVLDPKGTATRAELARILVSFSELYLKPETAEQQK